MPPERPYPLAAAQQAVLDAINGGPDAVDFRWFAGPPARVLLALRAHANTVSHARLTALEATFPRVLAALGPARFNRLARAFVAAAAARASDSNGIGAGFPGWLARAARRRRYARLAAAEWDWLAAYHAADAPPLVLGDFAGASAAGLLAQRIAWHPATRLAAVDAAMLAALQGVAGAADLRAEPAAVLLLTRPGAEVRLTLLTAAQAALAGHLAHPDALGNQLARFAEHYPEADVEHDLLTLIAAGALVRVAGCGEDAYDVAGDEAVA